MLNILEKTSKRKINKGKIHDITSFIVNASNSFVCDISMESVVFFDKPKSNFFIKL
jgi:hypothetical protein